MKPLKLRFQAFASYVEAAEIDFEKLDSLFLIHGETGAGKTAILDAMMYALYGESSGGEREDMRCVLPKAAELPTEVEFTFEVRRQKYKFTRSIELTPRSRQLKYKQDCFYFDEETGQFRAFFENPNKEPVKQKAEELTGLSAKQFRQVIILPQGRFERLLTSDSKEKEEILSTLFSAEKYSRLSEKLCDQADEERRALDKEEIRLNEMLAGENAGSAEELFGKIEELSRSIEELSPQIGSAKQNREKLNKDLKDAERLSESFSELSAARERLAKLDMSSEKIAGLKQILSLHEKSLKAKPAHTAFSEAKAMLDSRIAKLSAAKTAFDSAERELSALCEKQQETNLLEKTIAGKNQELALLNGLSGVYEKIGAVSAAAGKISAEYSECESSRTRIEASLKKIEAELSEKTGKREFIFSEYSRPLPELRAKKAELERGRKSAENLSLYETGLKDIKKNIEQLYIRRKATEKEVNSARESYTRLYEKHISNIAAELSSQLIEGSPCPVCGSLTHPAPAENHGDPVTSEQVRAARDKFEQAAEGLSDIKEGIAHEEARIPNAEQCIAECREVIAETGYSPEALGEASRKCAEAEKQNASIGELDRRINSLNSEKQAFEENLKKAAERSGGLKEQKAKSEAELAVLRERLVPDCPDQKSYAAKISALKRDIEAFEAEKRAAEERFRAAEKRRIECKAALEQAKNEHSAAERRYEEAKNAFAEKLAELGYPDEKQYESALLPEETAARYSEQAERYSLERHSAEEAVKSLSEKLDGKAPPDIEKIRAAEEEADRLFGELSIKMAMDSEKLSRLKKLSEEYSRRYADYETAREKSGRRLAFAKFMRGDKGISFTRYVLGIMLNLVTWEANKILAGIHGGMFRLCVKTDLASNSKQGLDLEVENTALSKAVKYSVKDLSGGEKFLISLALSLGLSQVARSRAGGVRMEAMFIDEGFGSLDMASLREAVGILCELPVGRNTIGIISHVEELRTVIPCGVRITKSTENGSLLKMRR